MLRTTVFLAVIAAAANSALAQKMTYDEANERLAKRTLTLPKFWVGDLKSVTVRLQELKQGKVTTIVKSPGGRPISLVTYGPLEKSDQRANFNSALGGRDPSAYRDKAARKRPVVFFVGPVHGHEVEGLTGLMNLIAVMETGRDLRGKEQPELRRLADQCRLVILPTGNPDGLARFKPRSVYGMELDEFRFWSMGTWGDDRIGVWPDTKREHPRLEANTGFLGCYFDNAGVNPMHDEFFAPMGTEAPAILRVAMQEGPDLAVSLHSCEYPPALLRTAYLPMAVQAEATDVAKRYYALLEQRGLPHEQKLSSTPSAETDTPPDSFNLTSALYHVSGATPLLLECPHGTAGQKHCQVTFDQILDIQLALYETMLAHELELKEKAAAGK